MVSPVDARPSFLIDALARLEEADMRRLSLDPSRDEARSFREIGEALAPELTALGASTTRAFVDGMRALALAIRTDFPDNLFADLDALAAGLLDEARTTPEPAIHLAEAFAAVARLHARFGQGSAIRFRYVHDFLYGFDWAKWVRRSADERAHVRPFDRRYLNAMLARGEELLALIDAGDPTFPPLREGARNPFRFSREPADELRLYRDLRDHELIPVRAWHLRPAVEWNVPYAAEREQRASALALTKDASTTSPTS